MKQFDNNQKQRKNFIRVNHHIRCALVRVVNEGEQLGIMPPEKALRIAQDAGKDLVEVVAHASPPVCHIIEFGKFRYQQKQKEKENKKKQKESLVEVKEIRLRPGIQDHDIMVKVNTIKAFIEDGKKVQINLQFKNREISHKEEGFRVINKIISSLPDIKVENQPKFEGLKITCRLTGV